MKPRKDKIWPIKRPATQQGSKPPPPPREQLPR